MIRAFTLQWRARVCRYGLALGSLPILTTLASVFVFQRERPGGLREMDVDFPASSEPPTLATVPAPVPGFERVVPVLARLPHPPLERLPGVLCHLHGNVQFGSSIAVYGNYIAIGATSDDTAGLEAGAVYIYERSLGSGEWQYRTRVLTDADQKLAARTLGRRQARFGRRVALGNGVLAVMQGSVYHGGPPDDPPEAVYVFASASDAGDSGKASDAATWHEWRQEARLPTPKDGRGHGFSLAFLDSHTLLVAAPMAAPRRDNTPEGVVYVYQRQPVGHGRWRWAALGELRPPVGAGADLRFAGSLQVHNNLIAVSMINATGGTKAESGHDWSVPLYHRRRPDLPPQQWEYLGGIPAPDHATGDFGRMLAMHDSLLAVYQGWSPREGTTIARQPRVFLYRAPQSGNSAMDWVYEGELPFPSEYEMHYYGTAIATDGRWIVVGAGEAGSGEVRPGLAFVYHRPPGQPWSLYQTVGPFDPRRSGAFGNVITMSDGMLLISGGDDLVHPDHGSVFIKGL